MNFQFPKIRELTNNAGFTLIEILVAFSIVAVITGIGVTSFANISRRQIVYESVTNLKQSIDQARFNAVSGVKSPCGDSDELVSYRVRICENQSCTGTNNNYRIEADCKSQVVLVSQKQMPDAVTFQPAQTGSTCQYVTFNSVRAKASGVPCSVRVKGYEHTINVTVGTQGYVSF
jgi:prepilin-type N-terminal cleavage/methylation domain-containing protein